MECSPQSPLSMGFSRQEYWSGLPFPPGDLPNPGVEPTSLTSPALQAGSSPLAPPVLRSLHVCVGVCGILPCVCLGVIPYGRLGECVWTFPSHYRPFPSSSLQAQRPPTRPLPDSQNGPYLTSPGACSPISHLHPSVLCPLNTGPQGLKTRALESDRSRFQPWLCRSNLTEILTFSEPHTAEVIISS